LAGTGTGVKLRERGGDSAREYNVIIICQCVCWAWERQMWREVVVFNTQLRFICETVD